MVSRMRKNAHLSVFSPVHDLSAIAGGSVEKVAIAGDEFAHQIVRVSLPPHLLRAILTPMTQDRSGIILRASTILKNDQWRTADALQETTIDGAINFRRVGTTSLYALSQPTEDGIKRVLDLVNEGKEKVVWINLREEPLLYLQFVSSFLVRRDFADPLVQWQSLRVATGSDQSTKRQVLRVRS